MIYLIVDTLNIVIFQEGYRLYIQCSTTYILILIVVKSVCLFAIILKVYLFEIYVSYCTLCNEELLEN